MEAGTANDTSPWIEIDLSPIASSDGTPIPFRLIVSRIKSSSSDSEDFIHDPLNVFINASSTVDALSGVDESWHVATFVTNHHRTLSGQHTYRAAAVQPDEKLIAVTLVKKLATP